VNNKIISARNYSVKNNNQNNHTKCYMKKSVSLETLQTVDKVSAVYFFKIVDPKTYGMVKLIYNLIVLKDIC